MRIQVEYNQNARDSAADLTFDFDLSEVKSLSDLNIPRYLPGGKYVAFLRTILSEPFSETPAVRLTFVISAGPLKGRQYRESLSLTDSEKPRTILFAKRLGLINESDFGVSSVGKSWADAIGKQVVIEIIEDNYIQTHCNPNWANKLEIAGIWDVSDPFVADVVAGNAVSGDVRTQILNPAICQCEYRCPRCAGNCTVTFCAGTEMKSVYCECGFYYDEFCWTGLKISHPELYTENLWIDYWNAFLDDDRQLELAYDVRLAQQRELVFYYDANGWESWPPNDDNYGESDGPSDFIERDELWRLIKLIKRQREVNRLTGPDAELQGLQNRDAELEQLIDDIFDNN